MLTSQVIQEHPNLLQFQDRWGLTALHSAAVAGCANVIAVLLDYRASVDGCSRSGQLAAGERVAPKRTPVHLLPGPNQGEFQMIGWDYRDFLEGLDAFPKQQLL